MSKSSQMENDIQLLIFNNVDIAGLGLRGSAAPSSLHISLHTADPGEGGSQSTNEVAYTGYARMARTRDTNAATGFLVTADTVTPRSNVDFPFKQDAGTITATHFGIGDSASGAGVLRYSGPIVTPIGGIVFTQNDVPRLDTSTSIVEE